MKCKCGAEIPSERVEAGYTTCLKHGAKRKGRTVGLAYNKGPLVMFTDKDLKELMTGSHKRRP